MQRPCARPGCSQLVDRGFCPEHAARRAAFEQRLDRERGSSAARGYDRTWKAFRARFLAEPGNQLCADCQTRPSQDVHHLQKVRHFPALRLVATNCRALCRPCHAARTLRGE